MKTLKLTFILTIIAIVCNAQISTREITKKEIAKPMLYDSSYFWSIPFNYNSDELKKYIGQEIFILPISKIETEREYKDFYYVPYVPYGNLEEYFKPQYDKFANQYLKIVGAELKNENEWYLKLLYNDSDTIYYVPRSNIYEYRAINQVPFIITAFFEKSKNQFLNETFIAKENLLANEINLGEKINIPKGEEWTCVDVTLVDLEKYNEKYCTPVLIFKNSKENEILVNFVKCDYDGITNYAFKNIDTKIENFLTLEEYKLALLQKVEQEKIKNQNKLKVEKRKNEILEKHGDYYGNLIINEKVALGMTMEMCKIAWGTPINTEELITQDGNFVVWQYNYKTFLYFENGKLKLIKQ